jgi:hypothetical protein
MHPVLERGLEGSDGEQGTRPSLHTTIQQRNSEPTPATAGQAGRDAEEGDQVAEDCLTSFAMEDHK